MQTHARMRNISRVWAQRPPLTGEEVAQAAACIQTGFELHSTSPCFETVAGCWCVRPRRPDSCGKGTSRRFKPQPSWQGRESKGGQKGEERGRGRGEEMLDTRTCLGCASTCVKDNWGDEAGICADSDANVHSLKLPHKRVHPRRVDLPHLQA